MISAKRLVESLEVLPSTASPTGTPCFSIPGTLAFIAAGWSNEQLPPGSLGYVNVIGFALIAPATVLAAPLGARLAHALSRRALSALFGLFLLVVAARMLF